MIKRTAYNGIVLTPTSRIKKTWPRTPEGGLRLDALGEVGERAIAQTLRNILQGKDNLPINLGLEDKYFGDDYIPITTNQLVERGQMTTDDERKVQIAGVDIIIIPHQYLKDLTKIDYKYVMENKHLCIQVKLQPFAPNYRSITVETCTDEKYRRHKKFGEPGYFTASGVNKTAAEWTVYIISASIAIFIKTEDLKEYIYGKERKYIGSSWAWERTTSTGKRAVGTTANILSLLQTGVAQPINIDEVFRGYFSQLHDIENTSYEECEHNWQLFVQGCSLSTLELLLAGKLAAIPDNELRGTKYDY